MQIARNVQLREIRNLSLDKLIFLRRSMSQKETIALNEIEQRHIVLRMPKSSLFKDNQVALSLIFHIQGKDRHFEAVATVSQTESLSESENNVHLFLNQFDPNLWKLFLKGFAENQDRVTKLLTEMKSS